MDKRLVSNKQARYRLASLALTQQGASTAAWETFEKVVALWWTMWDKNTSSIPDMKNHQFKQQSIIRHDSYRGWIPSVGDVLLLGLER